MKGGCYGYCLVMGTGGREATLLDKLERRSTTLPTMPRNYVVAIGDKSTNTIFRLR